MSNIFDQNEQNPYDTLVELVNFAQAADQHITNMVNNQKVMIEQFNTMKHRIDSLEMRLTAWEAVVSSHLEEEFNDASK